MQRKPNHPVLHESGFGEANQFQATWAIRAPWAHPVWPEYLLLLYDLKQLPGLPPALKHHPDYTHEMMLFAVSPDTPIDLTRPISLQSPTLLQPPNLGYQFTALTDEDARTRVATLVDLIQAVRLSPDTDARGEWDELFKDGTSLVVSNVKAMLDAIGAVRH